VLNHCLKKLLLWTYSSLSTFRVTYICLDPVVNLYSILMVMETCWQRKIQTVLENYYFRFASPLSHPWSPLVSQDPHLHTHSTAVLKWRKIGDHNCLVMTWPSSHVKSQLHQIAYSYSFSVLFLSFCFNCTHLL